MVFYTVTTNVDQWQNKTIKRDNERNLSLCLTLLLDFPVVLMSDRQELGQEPKLDCN